MLKKILALAALGALLCGQALAQSTPAATTNRSVVIVTGNTFQTVLAAGTPANRRSLTIQNNNATSSCWLVVGGALGSAAKGIAISLPPGASYTRYFPYIPNDAIHATCDTTANTLYLDTQ